MSGYGHTWRQEKASNIVKSVCRSLVKAKGQESLTAELSGILSDATKLMCDAIQERYGDSNRWSPDLVNYLYDNPTKADKTISLVSSEEYRDGYYD